LLNVKLVVRHVTGGLYKTSIFGFKKSKSRLLGPEYEENAVFLTSVNILTSRKSVASQRFRIFKQTTKNFVYYTFSRTQLYFTQQYSRNTTTCFGPIC